MNYYKGKDKNFLKSDIKPKIACLGLAFKPDIDDLRESKALEVATTLSADGYDIITVEPNIKSYESLKIVDLSEGIEQADLVCLLVKHREFLNSEIKEKLKKKKVLDFCGALSKV